MKSVAIIGFTNPFVNNSDGGKIDILMRIKALNNFTNNIDIYTVLKKGECEHLEKGVNINNIYVDHVDNKIINLFRLDPISVNNRYSKNIKQKIHENDKIYDIAIYENYNMYKYERDIKSKVKCLRVHNIESLSRNQLFKATLPNAKAFLEYIEGIKYKRVEKLCLSKFDYFLFISKDEMEYMSKKYPEFKGKFIWLAPATDISPVVSRSNYRKEILYYGDMTVYHNIKGLKWYVDNVLPEILKEENVELTVIGKISQKDKEYISKDNVNVLGYVDDLDEYISRADLVIAPIFTGAGVKIKVINTLSKGKILLTTTKGIEGTSFKDNVHLFVSDTKEECISKTLEIIRNPEKFEEIKKQSVEELKHNYSIDAQSKIIKSLI